MDFLDLLSRDLYGEIAVGVKNLEQAIDWYNANFGLVEGYSNSNEATLGYAGGKGRSVIPLVLLVRIPAGSTEAAVKRHPILFTRKLERARQNILANGISAGPIQEDSGGNRFFEFRDLEGNRIEVCLEPGKKLN